MVVKDTISKVVHGMVKLGKVTDHCSFFIPFIGIPCYQLRNGIAILGHETDCTFV